MNVRKLKKELAVNAYMKMISAKDTEPRISGIGLYTPNNVVMYFLGPIIFVQQFIVE